MASETTGRRVADWLGRGLALLAGLAVLLAVASVTPFVPHSAEPPEPSSGPSAALANTGVITAPQGGHVDLAGRAVADCEAAVRQVLQESALSSPWEPLILLEDYSAGRSQAAWIEPLEDPALVAPGETPAGRFHHVEASGCGPGCPGRLVHQSGDASDRAPDTSVFPVTRTAERMGWFTSGGIDITIDRVADAELAAETMSMMLAREGWRPVPIHEWTHDLDPEHRVLARRGAIAVVAPIWRLDGDYLACIRQGDGAPSALPYR